MLLIADSAGLPAPRILLTFEASFMVLLFTTWVAAILTLSLLLARVAHRQSFQ